MSPPPTVVRLDEIEFYTDLAMNESQRWIEAVTRERFFDEDDFLYSLRHGTQLRKILNIVRPGCISLTCSYQQPSCSNGNCCNEDSETENEIDRDEIETDVKPWTVEFLTHCATLLNFNQRQLFRISDLDALIDENGRQGCLPVETLSKIRRVVVTVHELAVLCETSSNYVGPKIDKTAIEPLINYHNRLVEEEVGGGGSNQHKNPTTIIQRGFNKNGLRYRKGDGNNVGGCCSNRIRKDVKSVLNDILDQVCFLQQDQKSGRRNSREVEKEVEAKAEFVTKEERFPLATVAPPVAELTSFETFIAEKRSSPGQQSLHQGDDIFSTQIPFRQKVQDFLQRNDFFEKPHATTTMSTLTADTGATYNGGKFKDYFPPSPMLSPSSDNVFYSQSSADRFDQTSPSTFRGAGGHSPQQQHYEEVVIPTRTLTKNVSASSENALKYVHSVSQLSQSAKQQIDKMQAQHLSREQLQKGEEDQDWKGDFDSWARKREKKSQAALRRKSERESIEKEYSERERGATGFFDKSGRGRSLNDVSLMDYGRDDHDDYKVVSPMSPPSQAVHSTGSALTTSTDFATVAQQDRTFDEFEPTRRSLEKPAVIMRPKSLEPSNRNPVIAASSFNRSPPQDKPFQSTPIHSGLSSLDTTGIEPLFESVRETKTVYEKQTTFVKSPNSPASAPYTVLTAQSKEENTNSKQTVTMDRDRGRQKVFDIEGGDSGVELNHPSPSPPLMTSHSLSPNSQSSTDGSSKIGKISPTSDNLYTERMRPISKGLLSTSGYSISESANKAKQNDRPYDRISISIRQRPNSEGGFGFSVKGGRDKREPIVVNTVLVNSSADKSRLLINDEVLEINGEQMDDSTVASANLLIREAVRIGQIDLLIRRYHPKQVPQANKPPISPRVSRKQSSFDETKRKFEPAQPPRQPLTSKSSVSSDSSRSHRPDYVFNQPVVNNNGGAKSRSPFMERKRNPGSIYDFVPPVDREPKEERSEYKVTVVHGRQSPGNILDYVPESERSSSASSRSVHDDDPNSDPWKKEKRIIEQNAGSRGQRQQHPSLADAQYQQAPVSRVHYDLPEMRPDLGRHSKSDSIDSALSSDHDVITPVYESKSVAATKIVKAIDNSRTSPKVVYETTVADSSIQNISPSRYVADESKTHVSPLVSKFKISSLPYQNGNLTEQQTSANNFTDYNRPVLVNGQNTPVQNYGLETVAFLAAKFRRINSTRRLRNRLREARLKYYGIRNVDSVEENETCEDDFEMNPYLKRIEDCRLYDLASRLISTSGTDLYFRNGPKKFTYDIRNQLQYSQDAKRWSQMEDFETDSLNERQRSVTVVPLRDRDPVRHTKEQDKSNNFENSAGGVRLAPRPFGHVRHEPVAFSFEPVPGGVKAVFENSPPPPPVPTTNLPSTGVSPDGREKSLSEIRSVFGGRSSVVGNHQMSDAEMKYLELASMESAPGAARPPAKSVPLSRLTDINDHWLVKEAETSGRLSDQLKAAERNGTDYYDRPTGGAAYSGITAYDRTGLGGYRGNEDVDQFGRAYHRPRHELDDLCNNLIEDFPTQQHRPPSPKFPTNSVLNTRYGLQLETDPAPEEEDHDDRVMAVSDRQICAHCGIELGRGAAMTIESLGLYYHLDCFKCYVCRMPLGDGVHGTDVRVKDRKLNCQSCYVNDQTGEVYTEL